MKNSENENKTEENYGLKGMNPDEEENQSIHTEEDSIDQSNETEEESDYKKQLEEYFEEVEQQNGIDYANKVRQKFAALKQLELALDSDEWSHELAQMESEAIAQIQEQNTQLFNAVMELIQLKKQKLAKE